MSRLGISRTFVYALRRPLFGSVILGSLLLGCTLPKHPTPESSLQTPQRWQNATGPGASTPLEKQWWQAFHDPALNALVGMALVNNSDLRSAAARVTEYQARQTIAEAGQWPSLTANFTPSRARALSALGVQQITTVYQGQLQASYEVDLWGRLASLSAAAVANLQGQQAAADAAALSVAGSVASAYLTLRGLDAQLALAQDTLASRQTSLKLAQRQFEVGYSSKLEVAQAEAEYRTTAQSIPNLQRSISQQENSLSLLIGTNPGPIARGLTLDQLQSPVIPAGLPSQLLRRRPDIYQAEQNIVAADANLAAARDQLLPSVQLNAAFGRQFISSGALDNYPVRIWSLGGSVLAPLFDAGRLRAQTEVAAAQRDQALFAYEKTVRNAFVETDNSLVAIERLDEQAEQVQKRRDASAESLRIAHNRYRNGYASYLDELIAQRTLFDADLSVLQLRTNQLLERINLYRALGGGWQVNSSSAEGSTGSAARKSIHDSGSASTY